MTKCFAWAVPLVVACAGDRDPEGQRALEAALATAGTSAPEAAPGRVPPMEGASPHRMVAVATLALDFPPDRRWTVRIERTIDNGPGGRFHVLDTRRFSDPVHPVTDHQDGREMIYDGARLVVRRAQGPWRERAHWQGEHTELLAGAYDAMPSLCQAFEPYLAWRPAVGPAEVLGLPVEWRDASLAPGVAPRAVDAATLAALHDHASTWAAWLGVTHRPSRISGRLAFRQGTSEVVSGEVQVEGIALVEGTQARFTATASLTPQSLPEASFAMPAQIYPATRPRPWRMIEDVLGEDLAPRYRPQP